jgi:protein-S-isoprenylcysteine O-methyltransferase Ste14
MKTTNKMILGYVIGGILVIVIFPSFIYIVSNLIDKLYKIELIQNQFIKLIIIISILLFGLLFGIWSIITQNIIGKGGPVEFSNIEISPKTKNLVVSGPYKYSRNPILFGTFLAYFAVAILINSLNAILIVLIFIIFMLTVVVKNEEKRLVKDFGNQYEEYRRKTSMIIPWFGKKVK